MNYTIMVVTQSVGAPEWRKPTLRLKVYCKHSQKNIQHVSENKEPKIIGGLTDNEWTINRQMTQCLTFPKTKKMIYFTNLSTTVSSEALHWI